MGVDLSTYPSRTVGSVVILGVLLVLSILVCTVPESRKEELPCSTATTTESGSTTCVGGPVTEIDTGDTAWVMVSCALVLLMTPGLSFFYGGMVRRKNMISTLLQSYMIMAIVFTLWVIIGFSLAFGDDWNNSHVLGNPKTYYFFRDVGSKVSGTIPMNVFALFQATFAMITPALITGSIVERANFNAVMIFVALWHIFVYCPIAHMVWAPGGLIFEFGYKDYAGGTVVEMSSGFSALVLAKLLGERKADKENLHAPAHIPYVLLGAALLWFGWLGFNGGSALASNGYAAQVLVTTNIAGSTAMMTWVLWDYVMGRKASAIGACGGLVVGLVAITPSCGFVTVGGAMILSMIASIISNIVLHYMKHSNAVDDTLDVFACHGVAGVSGIILTSLFTTDRVAPTEHTTTAFGGEHTTSLNGLFYGEAVLFWHTIVVCLLIIPFIMIMTTILYFFVDKIVSFRVSEEDEMEGLDSSYHGEAVGQLELPATSAKEV